MTFKTLSCLALACCAPLPAQMLVVDRGLSSGAAPSAVRFAKTNAPGFIGDHFQIGGTGEVWIVDAIRTWTAVDRKLPEVFSKLILFGGIEAAPASPGQPPQPECDCHNLMTIKSAEIRLDTLSSANADVQVAGAPGGIWQVDFRNLHWSIPGGAAIQFGVWGGPPRGRAVWYNLAFQDGGTHQLKAFGEKGELEGPYSPESTPIDSGTGLHVQVWAHQSVPVATRLSGSIIEVTLRSVGSFDAGKTDANTLRFGPRNAAPVSSRLVTVDGRPALLSQFRRSDAGVQSTVVSACLTGRQQDGVPFEGCDTVTSK